ncbi:MAG: Asp-tRNA(Asn)/Glu-tRNA(Gln) amidotransferase GatCAB subunit A, partial [Deltaproteobacteria bacterium]|nr:Asp-tRNA(Asn)/Glu-tRNA(Gln) amidotransferase GatCAB subunit A [Deltaproteobacteria bacterium]
MNERAFQSATELAAAVRGKEISATELADLYLQRADADADLGAYLRLDPDGARQQARAVDDAIASGTEVGPLAGVPFALKDALVTKGLETTSASKILEGWVPPYDGTA